MRAGKKIKQRRGRFVVVVLAVWMFWFQNVDASGTVFPFAAGDCIVFESELLPGTSEDCPKPVLTFMKKISANVEEQKKEKKQKKKKEQAQETMAVPVKYDRVISDAQRNILYKVVSMECDTGYEGSLAVISCMLNRLESGKYPDSLMGVVTQRAQFTAYYDRETDTYPYVDRVPSEECIAAVDDALAGKKRNLPSYILYFRSSEYKKLSGYKKYRQIGDNTYFYKEEDR